MSTTTESKEVKDLKDIKEKIDLGLLEEDDEFEEFQAEDWQEKDCDQDLSIWEDNWDDDDIENDFSEQLRHELEG